MISKKPYFSNYIILVFIWLLAGLITGWKQWILSETSSHINNFEIFRQSFSHFQNQLPLYQLYPKEYFDLYLYGPIFAILMAPFSWIPLGLSVVVWNMINSIMFFGAVWNLPMTQSNRATILWICLNSAITALLNTQFHLICVSLILWSYIFVRRGQNSLAALFIVLGVLIKFYGIIGLAFYFFSNDKLRLTYYLIGWFFIGFMIPILYTNWDYGLSCYYEWIYVLKHKNELNVDVRNLRTDVCVMGVVRRITGKSGISNAWFLFPSILILIKVYFQRSKWSEASFQLQVVALVLIYIMLASTGTESPTLVMAFPGVGLWFIFAPKTSLRWILLSLVLLVSSFSPTDIFPAYIRITYINRYALMILPLLVVWIHLVSNMLKSNQKVH